jgi:carboxylesterase
MNDLAAQRRDRPRFGSLMGLGDPSPIRHPGKKPTVLALHGFGGTPLEVALVTDIARELGHDTLAPLLPGHGTHAEDLARTSFDDWSRAARAALESVSSPESPAIVAGLSMGAVVALGLAEDLPDRVQALVVMANAIRLPFPFPSLALELVDRLGVPDFAVPKPSPDIGDPEARKTHLTYSSQPVRAAVTLMKAGAAVERRLDRVRCPVLIIHGKKDRVCPVSNAERVARLLASKDKTVVILPKSHNILTRDLERDLVANQVREFVRRVSGDTRRT